MRTPGLLLNFRLRFYPDVFPERKANSRRLRKSGALETVVVARLLSPMMQRQMQFLCIQPAGQSRRNNKGIKGRSVAVTSPWLLQFPSVVQHSESLCIFSPRRLATAFDSEAAILGLLVYCSHPDGITALKRFARHGSTASSGPPAADAIVQELERALRECKAPPRLAIV